MAQRYRSQLALIAAPPVLITESEDEFDRFRDALDQEIGPHGVVEQIYVEDFAHLTWEIRRLQGCKARIINARFRAALIELLKQLLRDPEQYGIELEQEAEDIADKWFGDKTVKKKILELLGTFQLDEAAIEAEAVKQSAADLELLDRLQASLESRRNRALRTIGEYRAGLAQLLRDTSNRIIEGKVVMPESASGSSPSAST